MEMIDRFRGCILGLCCGNSCGYPVEFIRSKEDFLTITNGKGITELPIPAIYSDDSQMTICIAEALIKSDGEMDKFMEYMVKRFIEWLDSQNDPNERRAPCSTCLVACQNLKAGISPEESGIPSSLSCGSAMRSAPIGLFFNKMEKIVDFGINSSKPTQTSPRSHYPAPRRRPSNARWPRQKNCAGKSSPLFPRRAASRRPAPRSGSASRMTS